MHLYSGTNPERYRIGPLSLGLITGRIDIAGSLMEPR